MSEQNQNFPIVFMKCKRGSDPATSGQNCDSKRVYNLSTSGDHVSRFKCVKCGHVWAVPVGGRIEI